MHRISKQIYKGIVGAQKTRGFAVGPFQNSLVLRAAAQPPTPAKAPEVQPKVAEVKPTPAKVADVKPKAPEPKKSKVIAEEDEEEEGLYSKDKDPMSKLSEQEIQKVKERINKNTRNLHTILYGMMGGALGAAGIVMYLYMQPPQ